MDDLEWKAAVVSSGKRKPKWHLLDQAAKGFTAEGLRVEDVVAALAYLGSLTGDAAFESARTVLLAYDFQPGGLKASVKRTFQRTEFYLPTMAMPAMQRLVEAGSSKRDAAKTVAIRLGIPGHTLSTVIEALRKEYNAFTSGVQQQLPLADTGRKLNVRLGPDLISGQIGAEYELLGQTFDESGHGIVPDDRGWRNLIAQGDVICLGESLTEAPIEALIEAAVTG